MKRVTVADKKAEKITDAQFMEQLSACGGKMADLAGELGIARQSAYKRKARILKKKAQDQGKALEATKQFIPRTKKQLAAVQTEVIGAAGVCREQFSALNEMRGLYADVSELRANIRDESSGAKGEKEDTKRLGRLLAVLERSESILRAYHTIEKDMYNAAMIRSFMDLLLMVVAENSPEIQKQFYEALKSAEPVFRAVEGLCETPPAQ